MCGRFVCISPAEKLAEEFRAENAIDELRPSYNVAPTQNIVIVKENGTRILTQCKWGLVPSWAKDESIGHKMINARAESVAEKPSFRIAFKNHRCLVVADGFYEWKKGKVKTPVYIRLKSGKPFGFAGLYSLRTSQEGHEICTSTIITTEANYLLRSIHDRMPVVISKENYDAWLEPESYDKDKLISLLIPYESSEMECYTVDSKVNSPSYDAPENIKPVEKLKS